MSRHAAYRARSLPQALGLTLVSALCPGSGFLMAGRVRLGAFVMTITAGLLGLGAYIGIARREEVLSLAVNPRELLLANAVLVFLGVCWIAIIIASHRILRPEPAAGRWARRSSGCCASPSPCRWRSVRRT
jgi:polyisoprenyl-teichoic acid--peptidoglycan teichoic acid transferase